MLSNKQRISGSIGKLRNERLSRRVTITFSVLFISLTTLVLILSVVICSVLLLNINKNSFVDFNESIMQTIKTNQSDILSISRQERLEYIYETYVVHIGDSKREISIEISDDFNTQSNDSQFETINQLIQTESNKYDPDSNQVQQIRIDKGIYYYRIDTIHLDGYSITLTTFQNIRAFYVYTLILSIVIGSALLLVIIGNLTLGRFATKKALAPLQEIADAVKEISEENLSIDLNLMEHVNEVDFLIVALNNMLKRLDTSFEEQKRFVSDVSHELRIPITIIQGYVDIMKTWGRHDPTIMEESMEAIYTETMSMKDLVEKLLLLQNLGSGNYPLEMEKVDVNKLLDKSVFETKLLTQDHIIKKNLSKGKVYVHADLNMLSQAIRSIIDNSIKYTNSGGEISIRSRAVRNKVYIQISDTGCGINKKDLARVKERFFRVDSARTKKTGGSGLGLSIVNAIIDALGGELIIQSELSKGSKFTIILPRY